MSNERRDRGTITTGGRGMNMAKKAKFPVVEANGGRIEVESRPGDGATFTVTIPAGE